MDIACDWQSSEAPGRPVGDENSSLPSGLLMSLLAAPNVGYAVLDGNLRYLYINDALAQMNGMPAEEHLGRTLEEIVGSAALEIAPAMRQVLTTGKSVSNFELTAILPNRSEPGYWLESYFPIADPEGAIMAVGAVVLECTELRKTWERTTYDSSVASQRLQAFLEFNGLMMSAMNEEELLPLISEFLQKVVLHQFSSVALYDKSMRRLRVHTLCCLPEGKPGAEDTAAPDIDSVYGPTFLHGEVKVHNRVTLAAADSELPKQLLATGIQSLCLVPLISRKGVFGTLNLGRKEDNAFDSDEIIFLKQLATQVAFALDNAAAYREIAELSQKLNKEKIYLQEEVRSAQDFDDIIGESPALHRVLTQVRTAAPSDATVLILGETGTGKELIARAIHRLSSRKNAVFIKLNCAAIPTGLLESELFGHEKGAFTGAITQKIGRLELADKGTLFLDEVGEIPLELQPKLLRVLQDQEFERLGANRTIKVDIRLIAATNRELAKSVKAHEFRSDLFYRLHVFPVNLPTLRDRATDIPVLVRYFVDKFAKRMNKKIDTIPQEAMRALQRWMWPGNVRELENFIERSVILTQGTSLSVPLAELRTEIDGTSPDSTLETLEREHILRVLRETGGVIARMHGAAARLGMKRTTLQSRMLKLGITREEYQN